MKRTKKLFVMLLAVVMMLAMNITAFADTQNGINTGSNGKIAIKNAVAKQTYNIYQMFELESYSYDNTNAATEQAGAYAYTIKSDSDWYNFISGSGAGKDYVILDLLKTENNISTYYVTWNTEKYSTASDYETFAKSALAYAKTKNVSATKTASTNAENNGNPSVNKNSDGTYTIVFSGLSLGYYLVDSSLGTLCSLDTTNPNVTIEEKNEEPTNDKKVQEDSDNRYDKINDADINQTINFQSTIIAKKGADSYVFHDKMSAGLDVTMDSDEKLPAVAVTLYKAETDNDGNITYPSDGATVEKSNYQVSEKEYTKNGTTKTDNDCTFHVVFTQAFCDTLADNDKLVISYSATLNSKAVVGGDGNTNDSWLDYGDDSDTDTSTTTTYTWELNVYKYTNHGTSNTQGTPLEGAKFVLYKEDTNNTKIYAVIAEGKITGWTKNSTSDRKEDSSVLYH